ncbi:peptidase M50B [Pyrrhoderma noxium]|uniref:Peptidase M50B n=1 Tax=Pyrrhoderma noxium TaxID=2282107 RepID=A0A286UK17_9AGAM|nr:peptidase M50B [Pyrrhoderma noxium]
MATRPPIAPKLIESPIKPTKDELVVLYITVVFTAVIFALWNIPGARVIINPLKLLTISWHEGCHIAAAILTGGTILSLTIDPVLGGCTRVEGGHPPTILSAGYIGSALLGGVFILGGFDTLVAKIESFILGIGLLIPLVLVRDKTTIILTLMYEGLLIGFWFIEHASALRWYCLFIGIMNVFYAVWDLTDDKFFRKLNDSDITQFNLLYPKIGATFWAIFWILWCIAVCIGFLFIGISSFKLNIYQMNAQAATFLPT